MRGQRRLVQAISVGLGLAVVGCGASGQGDGPSETTVTAQVKGDPQTVEDLCGIEAPGEYVELRPEGDSVLPGITMGDGEASVVLLAKQSGRGSCDWIGYGAWLAERDITVLAIDLCGQGSAECAADFAAEPAAQVELAVDHLRDGGAKRVTLLGASMGASIAQGVAAEVRADAVVAVSPPPEWEGVADVEGSASVISVPWFLISAKGDDGIDPPRLRRARERSSAPGEYRELPGSSHGYTLITDGLLFDPTVEPIGKEIVDWIRGDAPSE